MPNSEILLRRIGAAPDAPVASAEAFAEATVRRYHPSVRRSVRRLVRSTPRVLDLARVFPGAVYALAIRRGAPEFRQIALDLVRDGAALKDVAAALALPLWMRRLPPEAFAGDLVSLPGSEAFARRIANRMPGPGADRAFWLAAICFAARSGHEDFAIWLAEQPLHNEAGDPSQLLGVLALYAWFSKARGSSAQRLIVVPWRSELAIDTAICAAKSWFNRIRLVLQLRSGVISDPWLEPGSARGYTFTPLLDATELLQESRVMNNCADQYTDRIARDRCRLFSIRDKTSPVATLEVAAHAREIGFLSIAQLKGRHNMAAPTEVWQASYEWMASQSGLRRLPALLAPDRPLCHETWTELIGPYAKANGHPDWLPETATPAAFAKLDAGLGQLAVRAGVNSWLFT